MSWHAKPSGGYAEYSQENEDNALEVNGILNGYGFSSESQIGILANAQHEGGMNPWRLQGPDSPNWTPASGYGLFQYTPAWQYFEGCADFPGYGPNTTIYETLPTARPEDGYAQTIALAEDSLQKWHLNPLNGGWSEAEFPYFFQLCREGLQLYGSGNLITLEQFKLVDNPNYATALFLGCFERPERPNVSARLSSVPYFASVVSPDTPVPPPPEPGPGPSPSGSQFMFMFYLKPKWKRGF